MTILETTQAIGHDEFVRRLVLAAEEEVDEETTTRILADEAEPGDNITHDDLKRRLAL